MDTNWPRLDSHHRPSALLVVSCLILLLCHGNIAFGQNPLEKIRSSGTDSNSVTQSNRDSPEKTIEERLVKAREDLAETTRLSLGSETNRWIGFSLQDVSFRRHQLERLIRLYEQQQSFAAELKEATHLHLELSHDAQSWSGFNEPKPYSILMLDNLRESIQAVRLEQASGESAAAMLIKMIDEQWHHTF